jgi:diguanylate cyclase (GGDEF)-like protein/PAS domain S-box-containing protein
MKRLINKYLQNFTFERQLRIMVTLGIFLLALFSSVAGSWLSNERVRSDLIEQGLRITEQMAHQSELALIYNSAENAKGATQAAMSFPGVIRVEIYDINNSELFSEGKARNVESSEDDSSPNSWTAKTSETMLEAESSTDWKFVAPVYTQPPEDSPFLLEPYVPELLGYVSLVMSKESLFQATRDIFIANIATSFTFAVVMLLLIRFLADRMTLPLNQLSASMGRAKSGETGVRANLVGPKDISGMAHAFNSMMDVLEERESALRVAAIAFEVDEGMIVTDQEGTILRVNKQFSELSGYSPQEVIGENLGMFKSDRQDEEFYQRMIEMLKRDQSWQGEIWNSRKNGEVYPEWLTVNAVTGKDGEVTNYICGFFDITERKQAEAKIHDLAFYDPLCQLPNRRLLFDRLQQAVTTSARNKTCAGILFIDIDNFKTLNDTRGHDVGDMLLIESGQRLKRCIRESDTLARLGGDEFVILLEGLSEDRSVAAIQAREVAEKVLVEMQNPFELKNIEHYTTASIGVSLFSNYRQNLDDLLKQADTAMYAAKKSGRNAQRFFDPQMQEALEIRSQFEAALRKALPKNEFKLYYQMQIDRDGKPVGAEALIRWLHPEKGIVNPDKFIPVAEDTGLILPLGKWVLQMACVSLKAWESLPFTREISLAVNVSAREFRQPSFVQDIEDIIRETAVNPSLLKLELTESTVLDNVRDTVEKMNALKKIGIHFSMDDFGTGYSSLSYLTQLPLDQIKIDKSFVQNIGMQTSDATIIETIIGMSHSLGISVIAEGVETEAQRSFLLGSGCSVYQGFLFGRPLPESEFLALLNTTSSQWANTVQNKS